MLIKPKNAAEVAERWDNVIRVVDAIAADPHARTNHWCMGDWGWKTECGTVGCAIGHCSFDPYFRRLGLRGKFGPEELGLESGENFFDAVTALFYITPHGTFEEQALTRIVFNGDYRTPESVSSELSSTLAWYRAANGLLDAWEDSRITPAPTGVY